MATRDKREVRIINLVSWYNLYKAGIITLEAAKANVSMNGQMLFSSEIEPTQLKFPELDIADFTLFLNETGGLKKSGTKKQPGEGTGHATRLNTAKGATERGVLPEKVDEYINLVGVVYEACKELNKLVTNARCSFAIPVKKPEEEVAPQNEVTAEPQA